MKKERVIYYFHYLKSILNDSVKEYINPVVFFNFKNIIKKKKFIVSIVCYEHLPEALTERSFLKST